MDFLWTLVKISFGPKQPWQSLLHGIKGSHSNLGHRWPDYSESEALPIICNSPSALLVIRTFVQVTSQRVDEVFLRILPS